ncbi:hypothetical protein SNEBB_003141 [Seison nebaliae]|nr:hypothetical protein SNEBB_003141 [Seison nebaliae]
MKLLPQYQTRRQDRMSNGLITDIDYVLHNFLERQYGMEEKNKLVIMLTSPPKQLEMGKNDINFAKTSNIPNEGKNEKLTNIHQKNNMPIESSTQSPNIVQNVPILFESSTEKVTENVCTSIDQLIFTSSIDNLIRLNKNDGIEEFPNNNGSSLISSSSSLSASGTDDSLKQYVKNKENVLGRINDDSSTEHDLSISLQSGEETNILAHIHSPLTIMENDEMSQDRMRKTVVSKKLRRAKKRNQWNHSPYVNEGELHLVMKSSIDNCKKFVEKKRKRRRKSTDYSATFQLNAEHLRKNERYLENFLEIIGCLTVKKKERPKSLVDFSSNVNLTSNEVVSDEKLMRNPQHARSNSVPFINNSQIPREEITDLDDCSSKRLVDDKEEEKKKISNIDETSLEEKEMFSSKIEWHIKNFGVPNEQCSNLDDLDNFQKPVFTSSKSIGPYTHSSNELCSVLNNEEEVESKLSETTKNISVTCENVRSKTTRSSSARPLSRQERLICQIRDIKDRLKNVERNETMKEYFGDTITKQDLDNQLRNEQMIYSQLLQQHNELKEKKNGKFTNNEKVNDQIQEKCITSIIDNNKSISLSNNNHGEKNTQSSFSISSSSSSSNSFDSSLDNNFTERNPRDIFNVNESSRETSNRFTSTISVFDNLSSHSPTSSISEMRSRSSKIPQRLQRMFQRREFYQNPEEYDRTLDKIKRHRAKSLPSIVDSNPYLGVVQGAGNHSAYLDVPLPSIDVIMERYGAIWERRYLQGNHNFPYVNERNETLSKRQRSVSLGFQYALPRRSVLPQLIRNERSWIHMKEYEKGSGPIPLLFHTHTTTKQITSNEVTQLNEVRNNCEKKFRSENSDISTNSQNQPSTIISSSLISSEMNRITSSTTMINARISHENMNEKNAVSKRPIPYDESCFSSVVENEYDENISLPSSLKATRTPSTLITALSLQLSSSLYTSTSTNNIFVDSLKPYVSRSTVTLTTSRSKRLENETSEKHQNSEQRLKSERSSNKNIPTTMPISDYQQNWHNVNQTKTKPSPTTSLSIMSSVSTSPSSPSSSDNSISSHTRKHRPIDGMNKNSFMRSGDDTRTYHSERKSRKKSSKQKRSINLGRSCKITPKSQLVMYYQPLTERVNDEKVEENHKHAIVAATEQSLNNDEKCLNILVRTDSFVSIPKDQLVESTATNRKKEIRSGESSKKLMRNDLKSFPLTLMKLDVEEEKEEIEEKIVNHIIPINDESRNDEAIKDFHQRSINSNLDIIKYRNEVKTNIGDHRTKSASNYCIMNDEGETLSNKNNLHENQLLEKSNTNEVKMTCSLSSDHSINVDTTSVQFSSTSLTNLSSDASSIKSPTSFNTTVSEANSLPEPRKWMTTEEIIREEMIDNSQYELIDKDERNLNEIESSEIMESLESYYYGDGHGDELLDDNVFKALSTIEEQQLEEEEEEEKDENIEDDIENSFELQNAVLTNDLIEKKSSMEMLSDLSEIQRSSTEYTSTDFSLEKKRQRLMSDKSFDNEIYEIGSETLRIDQVAPTKKIEFDESSDDSQVINSIKYGEHRNEIRRFSQLEESTTASESENDEQQEIDGDNFNGNHQLISCSIPSTTMSSPPLIGSSTPYSTSTPITPRTEGTKTTTITTVTKNCDRILNPSTNTIRDIDDLLEELVDDYRSSDDDDDSDSQHSNIELEESMEEGKTELSSHMDKSNQYSGIDDGCIVENMREHLDRIRFAEILSNDHIDHIEEEDEIILGNVSMESDEINLTFSNDNNNNNNNNNNDNTMSDMSKEILNISPEHQPSYIDVNTSCGSMSTSSSPTLSSSQSESLIATTSNLNPKELTTPPSPSTPLPPLPYSLQVDSTRNNDDIKKEVVEVKSSKKTEVVTRTEMRRIQYFIEEKNIYNRSMMHECIDLNFEDDEYSTLYTASISDHSDKESIPNNSLTNKSDFEMKIKPMESEDSEKNKSDSCLPTEILNAEFTSLNNSSENYSRRSFEDDCDSANGKKLISDVMEKEKDLHQLTISPMTNNSNGNISNSIGNINSHNEYDLYSIHSYSTSNTFSSPMKKSQPANNHCEDLSQLNEENPPKILTDFRHSDDYAASDITQISSEFDANDLSPLSMRGKNKLNENYENLSISSSERIYETIRKLTPSAASLSTSNNTKINDSTTAIGPITIVNNDNQSITSETTADSFYQMGDFPISDQRQTKSLSDLHNNLKENYLPNKYSTSLPFAIDSLENLANDMNMNQVKLNEESIDECTMTIHESQSTKVCFF